MENNVQWRNIMEHQTNSCFTDYSCKDFIFLDKYVLRSGQCHGRHNDRHMCEKRIFKKSLWSTFNNFFLKQFYKRKY